MTPITKCEVCGSFVRIEGNTTRRYVPAKPKFPSFEDMVRHVEGRYVAGETITLREFYYWLKEQTEKGY